MKKKVIKITITLLLINAMFGGIIPGTGVGLQVVYADAVYNTNLVLNGSFANQSDNWILEDPNGILVFDTSENLFTDLSPDETDIQHYVMDFYPGAASSAIAYQIIDVSNLASDIANGEVNVNLSGYSSKYMSASTNKIVLEFLDESGNLLSGETYETVGNKSDEDDSWQKLSIDCTSINAQTRKIKVKLEATIANTAEVSSDCIQYDGIDLKLTYVAAPTVTDGNISISGASGTGGAYIIGDTVTATWDDTGAGDNNSDISSVTVDFSAFGGGAAVSASNSSDTWTATYTITSGAVDATNLNVIVTATNDSGNARTTSDTTNATVDSIAPTVTDGNISISGATGTGGVYIIGDTVTATWDDTGAGDNNSDISNVTVDFSAFGGGTAVSASNSSDTWTATYTIVSGSMDGTNKNVSVTATDNAGNTRTTSDTTNATVDSVAPIVTDGNISISGATGTGGAYKIGDTVTATWDDTGAGDNNSDISSVTVDFSAFGGGAAVSASNSSDTWTATYTITSGAVDATNLNVIVTATDNAGNSMTTSDTTNATVDSVAPTVTDGNISISGASGTGGAYIIGDTVTATWDDTGAGDNNSDISSVTVDFSAFGGGAAVSASNSSDAWTATYTITSGAVDATNLNVIVTVTDNAGNSMTTSDTTNATVDSVAPTVTDGNISISGASGTGGAYIIGDTVTATWDDTGAGDNNSDISNVIVDFSAFGGGAAVSASNSSDTWTATYTIVSGSMEGTNKNVSVTVTDNAGNSTTAADSSNSTIDNQSPSAPSRPDLSASSDTGISDTDNITYDTTPTIIGTAEAGSTVKLSSSLDGLVGTVSADGSGNWSLATSTLTNGTHNITATAADAAGNISSESTGLSIKVDSLDPTVILSDNEEDNIVKAGDIVTLSAAFNEVMSDVPTINISNGDVTNIGMTDSGDKTNWTYSWIVPDVDGNAYVTVTGKDIAGNDYTGIDNLTFIIENTVPSLDNNANLSGLSLSSGTLSPEFNSTNINYTVNVSNDVTSITVTPITVVSSSAIKVNNVPVVNGQSSGAINISVGTNTIVVEVTAEDGITSKTTTINVKRADSISNDADLSGVSISSGTLSPEFNAAIINYTANVSQSTTSVTITPTAIVSSSAIKVNNILVISGQSSEAINLNVGTNTILVEVTSEDGIATKTITINVTRASASSSKSTTKPKNTNVLVNGVAINAGISEIYKDKSGRTITTFIVDNNIIKNKLEEEGTGAIVTIPASSKSDIIIGQLNGQTIKDMEASDAILEVKTDNVSYSLPASQIDIDSVSKLMLAKIDLKDIKVNVSISNPTQDKVNIVEDTANKNHYQIVVKPVQFEITCVSGDKTIEVSKFKGYVERTIAIPDGIDPSKITTGVVLNHDGTFTHVPTSIIEINGKYCAKINSLTNSIYTLIYSPTKFLDMDGHWAEEDVNDMGSRLVVSGVNGEIFNPNSDITRAEFATILVRGLGLMSSETNEIVFQDVNKIDWYYNSVSIAYEYGIVTGTGDKNFNPNNKMTREEAMVMIARAMEVTKKINMTLDSEKIENLLGNYTDSCELSSWAKDSAAFCIDNDIITGNNSKLSAKENITRAETATVVRRLLKKAGLI
ncbi:hypothetical protein J2Z76_000192 [Sedimentibacter acidaminivorans]|uniref:SLH domain-containing protein n=1 Tax=Sedimentibacter acidaminivorans TaxID=913099 RepID=A0ABS4G9I9_9FIRM|nr:S-layer homology domain-containing protein [Sedimentibacter acidaminivorans]MBP1924339.1 hypothetical protein [Sedimentibacter acidaminivorans]